MSSAGLVADSATSLFNLPAVPDSPTCKQSLQVAPNVGEMAIGEWVEGEYGPATLLDIEVSKWRFSEKPKHILTFLDHSSGKDYTRSYFPWSPIKNNHAYEARFTAPHVNPLNLAPRNPYRPRVE